jgi:hypothetical protein
VLRLWPYVGYRHYWLVFSKTTIYGKKSGHHFACHRWSTLHTQSGITAGVPTAWKTNWCHANMMSVEVSYRNINGLNCCTIGLINSFRDSEHVSSFLLKRSSFWMLAEWIFKQTTQILFHVFPYNFLLHFGRHTLRWIGDRYNIYIYIYIQGYS